MNDSGDLSTASVMSKLECVEMVDGTAGNEAV